MALVYSGLTQWVDESRLDFYLDAVATNDVLPFVRQYGQVITGVKADSIKLPRLSSSVTIADGTNCFTDIDGNNDSTISQATITLSKGLVRDQICVHGLEDYYTAQGLNAGQHYTGLGAFEAGILQSVAGEVGKAIGSAMWTGSANFIANGWTDLLYAANLGTGTGGSILGTSTPTSGGAAGTDAAGVYNICTSLLNAAMADVDFASEVISGQAVIVMSPQDFLFLQQNYTKLNGGNTLVPALDTLNAGTFATIQFPGTRVNVVTQNFLTGTGTIILSRRGNFVTALDLESDFTNIVMGMDQYQENIWWKFRFKAGVGFRDLSGNSIKYWGPAS
jgi:hypothetical protein